MRKGWASPFAVLLGFPAALLTYGVVGIGIARAIGIGHFYSVPFGAEHIRDWHILASLAFWTCLWGGALLWLLTRRHGAA